MVESELDYEQQAGHIVLSPNMSARWRTNVYFLYTAVFFALCIGIGFSLAGAWLVLPFTGLEIVALVSLIYYVAQKCHHIEVIHISQQKLKIERGYKNPQTSWESDIFWTRLVIGEKSHPMRSMKLFLRNRQQQIEIGRFLNDNDKKLLLRELQRVVSTG